MNPFLSKPFLIMLLGVPFAFANNEKPIIPPEEYGRFEMIWRSDRVLSRDGSWLAYEVERVSEENELRVCHTHEEKAHVLPMGKDPEFSANSSWLKWMNQLSKAEQEKLKKDGKEVRNALGLMALKDGTTRTFEDITRSAFDETGDFIALLGHPADKKKNGGANLSVLNLKDDQETLFGNVEAFQWSESGSLIAMVIKSSTERGNSLQVYDAAHGRLRTLDTSKSLYRHLSWREDAFDLAVLRSVSPAEELEEKEEKQPEYSLLVWRGLDQQDPSFHEMQPASAGVPESVKVVGHAKPRWSPEGDKVSVGLRPLDQDKPLTEKETSEGDQDADKPKKEETPDTADVQIWHSRDVRIIPQQQYHEKRDQKRVLMAVWHLDENRMVQIGTDLLAETEILENWRFATERSTANYPWGEKFGRRFEDVWVVDLQTGIRKLAFEKARYTWNGLGKRLLHFDGTNYVAYDLLQDRTIVLTKDLKTSFANRDYDIPTDMLPPHGVGGWLKDDTAVLLYDKHNVWHVPLDGSKPKRLTDGDAERKVHRVLDLDKEEKYIDPSQDLYFSLWGEWSEKRGFAKLAAGEHKVQTLVYKDASLRNLLKAAEADVFVYTDETAVKPTEIVMAEGDLKPKRSLDNLNSFQKDYAWTRSELINYKGEHGEDLQGVLLYPANYKPGQRYPMIVYVYEKLSNGIHWHRVPDPRNYFSYPIWNQLGYAVLLPDIVYKAREPGPSAVASVRPAVRKVVEMGVADEAKVGLAGISWGGYQAAYLPTRTKLFAASVSAAPLTDFVSFMGQIHWHPGIAETSHWETGQGRMEVPYWEDVDAYLRNSPIHKIHELETPILMAHGDKDMTVEFFQATVFYNYARRAEKDMVLLVYEDESHSFNQKKNRLDFHHRVIEWFDHHLKGEPAPEWITEGIKLPKLKEERRRVADKAKPKPEE